MGYKILEYYKMNTLIERLNELLAQNLSTAKIKAYLTLEDYSMKDINEAFKLLNVKSKKVTFATSYYDWLSAEVRTADEASNYINGLGEYGETSVNVIRNLKHYLNIAELTIAIWGAKAETKDEMDPELKAAWAIYEAANAKVKRNEWFTRAEANRVHPDKVAKFDDEALTEAYNRVSKALRVKAKDRKSA